MVIREKKKTDVNDIRINVFERLIDNLIVDEIIIIIIYFPRDFNILHFCLQVSGLNLLLYRNLWSLMILFNLLRILWY